MPGMGRETMKLLAGERRVLHLPGDAAATVGIALPLCMRGDNLLRPTLEFVQPRDGWFLPAPLV